MNSINDRIAWVVEQSGMTRTAFAEKLNVSQSYVTRLASGEKAPSDRTIADICRIYGISESWLRTGEGEPKIKLDEDQEFQDVLTQIRLSDDDLIKRIIKAYWYMSDEEKKVIKKLIERFQKEEKK